MAAVAVVVGCGVAAAGEAPDRLPKAKAGEWVMFKLMGGMQQKQTITDIKGSGDDMEVTIKTEVIMNGATASTAEQTIKVGEMKKMQADAKAQADASGAKVAYSNETVEVKGKKFDAVVVTTEVQGMTAKTYMSDEMPVGGIIKMYTTGMAEPVMEVIDFGTN